MSPKRPSTYRPPRMSGRRIRALVGVDQPRPRKLAFPLANSSRHKERRWPLVLRFTKGAIHGVVWAPVLAHSCFTAMIVCLNRYISSEISLPTSIIPSLSIVVGLMLVFRNQTAYSRMWDGRLQLSNITTAIRCLSRQILSLSPAPPPAADRATEQRAGKQPLDPFVTPIHVRTPSTDRLRVPGTYSSISYEEASDAAYVEETVRILIALLFAIRNHLRTNWGVSLSPGTQLTPNGQSIDSEPSYGKLLPLNLMGYEDHGLSLPLQLVTFIEVFVDRGQEKGWFHNAACSSMLGELHSLTASYTMMETIRLTPIPVMHVIHHRQTLALYCLLLPLSIVSEIGWWSILLTAVVSFTLYGIEGIAQGFEDPFKRGKGDVDLDGAVEDCRGEVECLLDVWRHSRIGRDSQESRGWMFRPRKENYDRNGSQHSIDDHLDHAPRSPGGHLIPETKTTRPSAMLGRTSTTESGVWIDHTRNRWDGGSEDLRTPDNTIVEDPFDALQPQHGVGEDHRAGAARRATHVGSNDEGVVSNPVFLSQVDLLK